MSPSWHRSLPSSLVPVFLDVLPSGSTDDKKGHKSYRRDVCCGCRTLFAECSDPATGEAPARQAEGTMGAEALDLKGVELLEKRRGARMGQGAGHGGQSLGSRGWVARAWRASCGRGSLWAFSSGQRDPAIVSVYHSLCCAFAFL